MSHLHATAIAPLALPWEDLIKFRRNARRLWDTANVGAQGIRIGAEGALFLDDNLFTNFGSCTDFALESARFIRRNDSIWFPFSKFSTHAFDEFRTKHNLRGTLSAHLVLTRNGTLSLIAGIDLPEIAGTPSFDQRDLRRIFEATFFTKESIAALNVLARESALRPFFGHDSVPAPSAPRPDSTHIFTVAVGADATTIAALRRPHADEEGASDSQRDATGQAEAVEFVRFGWSYTTLAVRQYAKEIALLPLMIYLQNLWFMQKSLREQVGFFGYDDLGIKRVRTLAIELEALNIERTFAGNEMEDFRSNLKPWLTTAFDFVFTKWGLADTRTGIEQIVGNLREYYERKLEVYDSRQAKRQASVLFWIALLQCSQMFANLAGYFYFLELSDVDVSEVTTSGWFIISLVVSPIVLTILSVFAAWLYFAEKDARQ